MFDQGLLHAPAPVYVGGPRGSPKPTWRWCWYSGARSWAALVVWAHRPPMGVYRTALVPVLSHAHGRGWRRTFCPCKQEVISGTLKDILTTDYCTVYCTAVCVYTIHPITRGVSTDGPDTQPRHTRPRARRLPNTPPATDKLLVRAPTYLPSPGQAIRRATPQPVPCHAPSPPARSQPSLPRRTAVLRARRTRHGTPRRHTLARIHCFSRTPLAHTCSSNVLSFPLPPLSPAVPCPVRRVAVVLERALSSRR